MKAFVNARIFDGLSDALSPHTTILVGDDGRIGAVGGAGLPVPPDARRIDCQQQVVLPGLIDMHTHLQPESLAALLAHGVTTARDVGNETAQILGLRAKTAAAPADGPRIHCAGQVLDGPRPMWQGMSIPVGDPDSAAAAVGQLAGAGVDGIKLYMGVTPELLPPIVAAAAGRGLPVTAHLGAASALDAARAGVSSLEHACQSLYASLVPEEEFLAWDQRQQLGQSRFWARFHRGWATVDPDSGRTADVLGELADRGVALDATLVVNQRIADFATDPGPLRQLEAAVDPAVRQDWVRNAEWFTADWTADDRVVAHDSLQVVAAVTARFAAAGGTVVAGTDMPFSFLVPGVSLHEELEQLVRAGLSAGQALQAATGSAARVLGWSADVGAIAPGRYADLVVSRGDPLSSITDSAAIAAVYRAGEPVCLAPESHSGEARELV